MVNAIGIDLGTSKCCVGVFRDGKVEIIPDELGNRITPSYVAFNFNGPDFSSCAKSEMYSWNTIFSVLRLLGREFGDPVVQSSLKNLPFSVFPTFNGRITIEVNIKGEEKRLYLEEIVAMLLVRLKQSADAFFEADVKDVVITTSGQLGLRFRRAIFDAAQIAGLNVLRIINASTATAIAHFFNKLHVSGGPDAATINVVPAAPAAANVPVVVKQTAEDRNDLIIDFGDGNLDVSVVSVKNGQRKIASTVTDNNLGGEDVTNRLFDHFAAEMKRKLKDTAWRIDYKDARLRLLSASKDAKHKLSNDTVAVIELREHFEIIAFNSTIHRSFFDGLCFDIFQRALTLVERAIRVARVDIGRINDVILLGGSSQIPAMQTMLLELFSGKELIKLANPEEIAVSGAAIHAVMLSDAKSEDIPDLIFDDVVPLSLGIEEYDNMLVVIKRNSILPAENTVPVYTRYDKNNEITIRVFEGNRKSIKANNFLCRLKLNGIPYLPDRPVTVEVTFQVDAKGILTVSAYDKSTDKTGTATFPNEDNGFSEQQMKVMISTHKNLMCESMVRRERIIAMNRLQKTIASIEENKRKRKLEEQEEHKVYRQCKKTFNWLERNDMRKTEELQHRLEEAKELNRSFSSGAGI